MALFAEAGDFDGVNYWQQLAFGLPVALPHLWVADPAVGVMSSQLFETLEALSWVELVLPVVVGGRVRIGV